jgi:hypothetical protein
LCWPTALELPSKRFRLFVAAEVSPISADVISEFAAAALNSGMVYFCAWGCDCERFHDIVDEAIVEDELGERWWAGPNADDTIMTTWHARDSLAEALDFFVTCAMPTAGFKADGSFRLVICVGNSDWAEIAKRFLDSAPFDPFDLVNE